MKSIDLKSVIVGALSMALAMVIIGANNNPSQDLYEVVGGIRKLNNRLSDVESKVDDVWTKVDDVESKMDDIGSKIENDVEWYVWQMYNNGVDCN